MDGFSLVWVSHNSTEQDTLPFRKAAYVLIKKIINGILLGMMVRRIGEMEAKFFAKGLDSALAQLPNKAPEELSDSETARVKNIIMSRHRSTVELLGSGNGWVINQTINKYLAQFFDAFLKNKQDSKLKKCIALTNDTYIKCGSVE